METAIRRHLTDSPSRQLAESRKLLSEMDAQLEHGRDALKRNAQTLAQVKARHALARRRGVK